VAIALESTDVENAEVEVAVLLSGVDPSELGELSVTIAWSAS
jgi:hypothetical protein